MKFWIVTLFFCSTLLSSIVAQDIQITAEVNTNKLVRGESGRYTIRVTNTSSAPQLKFPVVSGLEFSGTPQTSQKQQYINGVVTREIEYTWYFRGKNTGHFVIPGQRIEIRGQSYTIDPISIEIVENEPSHSSNYFLKVILDERPVYLGEPLVGEIKLFTKANVQITPNNLVRRGDGFVHQLEDGQAEAVQTLINGIRYIVRTWRVGITPIKAGSQELSFEMPAVISQQTQRDPFGSLFNFNGINSEPITLYSQVLNIDVLEVPADGKPPSYGGGIGDFEFTAKLSTRDLQVGEPFTLTLSLSGVGNFDRIPIPQLALDESLWKVYPPKQNFEPADKLGHSGILTFEYIIIPQSDSIESFPSIEYATFNPLNKSFKTSTIESEPVTVSPARPLNTGFIPNQNNYDNDNSISPDRLRANLPDFGSVKNLTHPIYRQQAFWFYQLAIAFVILLLYVVLNHRKKLSSDSDYASQFTKSKRVKKHLEDAFHGLDKNNAEAFYANASKAIKVKIGLLHSKQAAVESLVISELIAILTARNIPQSQIEQIQRFFEQADAIHFAAFKPSPEELQKEAQSFKELLKSLPHK